MGASASAMVPRSAAGRWVAFILGAIGSRVVFKFSSSQAGKRAYGSLLDQVAFSSRMIAAARAAESEREDALFVDPLAAVLAGDKAMARRRATVAKQQSKSRTEHTTSTASNASKAQGKASDADAAAASGSKRRANNITSRTCFLDDLIRVLTGSVPDGGPAPPDAAQQHYQGLQQRARDASEGAAGNAVPFLQVVLVGAGMDTRAWRLQLRQGVQWVEVDQQRVLDAKLGMLATAGAQTSHSASAANAEHTLKCSSYHAVGLDITQDTLTAVLRRSAFDAKTPTLWILEGLTYYLSEDDNRLLFGSMAALSAPGSIFAATMAPKKLVDKLKKNKKGGLMSTWKWGFPADFAQVARNWGWNLVDAIEYVSIATLYGCEYGFKQGKGQADSVFGILQPPETHTEGGGGDGGLDFSGDYVRVVSGVLAPQC